MTPAPEIAYRLPHAATRPRFGPAAAIALVLASGGTATAPAAEPERHAETENDARLRAEKPPHY